MATIKQKRAFEQIGVNGGNITQAMLSAGYSKKIYNKTDKLTRSKGWQELMDQYLPDSKLAKVHGKLLDKKEVVIISDGTTRGSHVEYTEQPHSDAVRALDIGYKVKHKYPTEGGSTNNVVIIQIAQESANKYNIIANETNPTASSSN